MTRPKWPNWPTGADGNGFRTRPQLPNQLGLSGTSSGVLGDLYTKPWDYFITIYFISSRLPQLLWTRAHLYFRSNFRQCIREVTFGREFCVLCCLFGFPWLL